MTSLSDDSHDTIARAIVEAMSTDESPMIFDGFEILQYVNGIWLAIDQGVIASRITGLLSKAYIESAKGKKKLRISKSLIDSVLFVVKQLIYQPPTETMPGCLFSNWRVSERLDFTEPNKVFFDRVRFEYELAQSINCPMFIGFLDELFQPTQAKEKLAFVEFVGASMLGIASRFQTIFALYGLGANGKSELINLVVGLFPNALIGSVSVSDWGDRFSLVTLKGKRLNAVSELPDRNELLTEKFKLVTSGDLVKIEQKNRPVEVTRITCGHIFSTNSLAGFINVDAAVMRRLAIVEFKNFFKDKPKRDIAKTILEAERSSIARLCLEASQRLIARGFYDLPKDHYITLIAANDMLFEFATRHIDRVPKDVQGLYTLYRDYVKSRGSNPVNAKNFETRLKQYGFVIKGDEVSCQ